VTHDWLPRRESIDTAVLTGVVYVVPGSLLFAKLFCMDTPTRRHCYFVRIMVYQYSLIAKYVKGSSERVVPIWCENNGISVQPNS
jgi:hypothetical protein